MDGETLKHVLCVHKIQVIYVSLSEKANCCKEHKGAIEE